MNTYLLTKSNEIYILTGEFKTETGKIIYKIREAYNNVKTHPEPSGAYLVVSEDEVSLIDSNYSVILEKSRTNRIWKTLENTEVMGNKLDLKCAMQLDTHYEW